MRVPLLELIPEKILLYEKWPVEILKGYLDSNVAWAPLDNRRYAWFEIKEPPTEAAY